MFLSKFKTLTDLCNMHCSQCNLCCMNKYAVLYGFTFAWVSFSEIFIRTILHWLLVKTGTSGLRVTVYGGSEALHIKCLTRNSEYSCSLNMYRLV